MAKVTFTLQTKFHPFYNIIVQLYVWFPEWARKKLGNTSLISMYEDGNKQPLSVIKVEDVFKSLDEEALIETRKNFKGSKTIHLN